ncbi:fatty acid hydroxylase family protein [Roseibium denhamense]|uniref:Sterol desaturase/sphingolipid hydroxylase, fatty acid hydroxylase superfamily n=1 Tax=Roseibium denhamense TaxID=76305 RepID=A0ABY1PKD9_9HYPH|nr:sterol desaturase family protein [Roseibium denhamense]MTI04697.1 fatty acid hydroxylase family protein [Roseibium denhamense]SMP33771.1 Sterol desaturase/sphingolipid hydroxylase, fatty acid hydroxylase superfamily [Roseibium denhamense]
MLDWLSHYTGTGIWAFAALFCMLYAVSITVLFATGLTMTALNKRHPDRKIQKRAPTHDALRDIKSSMVQLSITSTCLAIGLYAQMRGWTLFDPFGLSWWSVPVFFVLSLVLHDTWFYWGHRILHTKMFYRFHKPHHMTITPTVWSNDAGSSVDTLFAHSYYALVLFVVPMPPLVFLGHRLFDQVSAAIGHCGYEHFAAPSARKPWPLLCTLYHDQHHQYFVYNYANYFSFWDRLCGTIHPTYDGKVEGFEQLYAGQKQDAAE